MRILVAPDKFKGSLDAAAVAECIGSGLRDVLPEAEITLLPIADGGEGTASVICAAAGGEWRSCDVHDPLGRIVSARYGTIATGGSAVMEMSEASGLWRVAEPQCDPTIASTFGTGEMLLAAGRAGAKEIIIGLGGSATNDGGFGMARALGFRFFDADKRELTGRVSDLVRLAHIERPASLHVPVITAAVDVRNPLLGARGATRIFAAQKGASAEQIELLECALLRLADVALADFGVDHREAVGAGAAGGLGFGLAIFCSAELRSGFDVVAERIALRDAVRAHDIVITGEGRLDAQTLEGKAPAGIARLARKFGKSVYAIVGEAVVDEAKARTLFDGIFPLTDADNDVERSMSCSAELLRIRSLELGRLLRGAR